MSRIVGVAVFVLVLYAALLGNYPNARSAGNHQDMARYFGYYGVLSLGVGTLIIAGGIDLSIGSLVGLCAVLFGLLLERQVAPWLAAGAVVGVALAAGLWHGLLVTRLGLQPFLVTLCGLFIYRGLAQWSSNSSAVGLGVSAPAEYRAEVQQLAALLVKGSTLKVPNVLLVMVALALVLAVLLHGTVYGRYLYAIGANEQAARYAGVPTGRYKVLSYMISSACAGLGGILFLCENETAQPTSAGSLDELYAITGAVLGGCSLKGGVGSVLGMVLGAMVLPLLRMLCNFSPIGSELVYAVTGVALLIGTIVNELIGRRRA
jgi:ribose transport system permease protein